MDISAEGKKYLKQAIEKSEVKTLRFFGIPGCCNVNLGVALEDAQINDEIIKIDEITVAIDPSVKSLVEDVTIHAEEENGEMGLLLVGYTPTSCN